MNVRIIQTTKSGYSSNTLEIYGLTQVHSYIWCENGNILNKKHYISLDCKGIKATVFSTKNLFFFLKRTKFLKILNKLFDEALIIFFRL